MIGYLTGSMMDKKNTILDVDDFQGSPYTSDKFKFTSLIDKGEEVTKFYYRYNAYNEEIEIKSSPTDSDIGSLSRDKSLAVIEDGKKLIFKTFIDKTNTTMNGYLLELVDGEKYNLYKRTKVKFTEGAPAANSFVKATPNRFSQFTEYYIEKEGGNRIDEIETSNRKILKVLEGSDKEKVKAYLKEKNVKVRNVENVVKIVELLNQIKKL
ncbi:hypothetical protein [Flagellimonas sp.]|uniref:hypothetical protein n=1 Tax=Flagellimonas sp. TaxID=2058762 RepID=UPI003BAA81C5